MNLEETKRFGGWCGWARRVGGQGGTNSEAIGSHSFPSSTHTRLLPCAAEGPPQIRSGGFSHYLQCNLPLALGPLPES